MATNNDLNTGVSPLPVSNGGSGVATMTTAYAPVCSGTSAAGALQVASTGLSTSGYVLTSTGASSLPTFQAAPTGTSPILFTTVSLSSSQILGMYATPVQLIAAPGANKLIRIFMVTIERIYASAYTAPGNAIVQYDSTAAGAGVQAAGGSITSAFFTATTDGWTATGLNTTGAGVVATSINKGIFISNQSSAYTGGTSTFNAFIYYSVISTTI